MKKTRHKPKKLICGCCGNGFKTWATYRDQDQDTGYGICMSCQYDQWARDQEKTEELFQELYQNVTSKKAKAKLDEFAKDYAGRKAAVHYAIEKGIFTWSFK